MQGRAVVVARQPHKLEVARSTRAPATNRAIPVGFDADWDPPLPMQLSAIAGALVCAGIFLAAAYGLFRVAALALAAVGLA